MWHGVTLKKKKKKNPLTSARAGLATSTRHGYPSKLENHTHTERERERERDVWVAFVTGAGVDGGDGGVRVDVRDEGTVGHLRGEG